MKRLFIPNTHIIIIVFTMNLLLLQIKPTYSETKMKKWNISFNMGTSTSGPAKDIENVMIKSGFNKTSPSELFEFGEGVKHPFSNTGFGASGFPWSLKIVYSLSSSYDIGIIICNTEIGSTHGYHRNADVFLELQHSVFAISPIFYFTYIKYLKLGVGPSFLKNSIYQVDIENKRIR